MGADRGRLRNRTVFAHARGDHLLKRVLVTGGSMGIGLAVAQTLGARGTQLTLVARGEEALKAAAASIPGVGHKWHAFDVCDGTAWDEVEIDALDGLVCAAAVVHPIG